LLSWATLRIRRSSATAAYKLRRREGRGGHVVVTATEDEEAEGKGVEGNNVLFETTAKDTANAADI